MYRNIGRNDYDSVVFNSKLSHLLEEDTTNIKVKNPGITELPEGAWNEWTIGKLVDHLYRVAGKDKRQEIARAVNNIARFNENRDPELSDKAKSVMSKLHDKWEE